MQTKAANDSYQYNLDPSGSESQILKTETNTTVVTDNNQQANVSESQILKTETNTTVVTDNNQQAKKNSEQASISPFMPRLIILFVMAVV